MATHFLRRKEASRYLRDTHGLERAPTTLAKLAVIGGGPAFRRAGRIPLYARADLDDWVASILSGPMRTTSEVPSVELPATEFCKQDSERAEAEGAGGVA
jgi:hypothetical protein